MDMKVDSSYIKAQRSRRAWSQEHLAEVTGLGLRTIQRIEKTGAASYESARSLAAVFEIDVAELRVADPVLPAQRISVSLRPVLGVVGALVAGGALLITTSSFAADQVLMDVALSVDSPTQADRALAKQLLVDDGVRISDVNDLTLGNLRFSIVPRVQAPDRILLEVSIYERRGDEEVIVAEPRLISVNAEPTGALVYGDAHTLRFTITAQVNPPRLSSQLRDP